MKNIYDNKQVRRWEDIPFTWRIVDAPSQVKIKSFTAKDKDFSKVFGVFASDDELRPAMTGVNFDDNGLCITDAHKMVFIPKSKYSQYFPEEEGIFEFGSGRKIDERYPNYSAVIPQNNTEVHQIDVVKLLTYCNMILKGQYCNQSSFQCSFVYGKESPKTIGFNLKFLKTILEFWLKMGFKKLFISIEAPNRAALFSPYEKGVKGKDVLDYPVTLLMPVMTNSEDYFGARDLDYERESLVHYVFTDDEIYDVGDKLEDVKPAKFDFNLTSYADPNFSNDEIKMWGKLTSKSRFPITDCVKIKDGIATVNNLSTAIKKSGIVIPNGLYNMISGSLSKSTLDIDDFPVEVSKDSAPTEYNGKYSFEEFRYQYNNSLKCVGDDELRPTLMAIHISNSLIEATNSYILYRQNLKSFVEGLDVMVAEPKWLSEVMEIISDDENNTTNDIKVQIYSGDYGRSKVSFIFDRHEVICKIEDSKYPNTQSIIPSSFGNLLTVNDISEVSNAIKSVTKEQIKDVAIVSFKHNQETTDLILFDKGGERISDLGSIKSSFSNTTTSSETGLFSMPSPLGANIYDFSSVIPQLKDIINICGKNGKVTFAYNGATSIILTKNENNFEFIENQSTKKKPKPTPSKKVSDDQAKKIEELRLRARARMRILALQNK